MDFPQLGRKLLDLYVKYRYIGEALRNLVPFVQFKKIEKIDKKKDCSVRRLQLY